VQQKKNLHILVTQQADQIVETSSGYHSNSHRGKAGYCWVGVTHLKANLGVGPNASRNKMGIILKLRPRGKQWTS